MKGVPFGVHMVAPLPSSSILTPLQTRHLRDMRLYERSGACNALLSMICTVSSPYRTHLCTWPHPSTQNVRPLAVNPTRLLALGGSYITKSDLSVKKCQLAAESVYVTVLGGVCICIENARNFVLLLLSEDTAVTEFACGVFGTNRVVLGVNDVVVVAPLFLHHSGY